MRVAARTLLCFLLLLALAAGLSGCTYFRQKAADRYVYVTARQTFLRDRVAAVSNRTGTATNGEKLVVLERARRFLKVRTPRGEVGWIEEKLTADQNTADQFVALKTEHERDPIVASATVRDEVYLHIAPGRETERFYRLTEGDNLSLLQRATVPRFAAGTTTPTAKAAETKPAETRPAEPETASETAKDAAEAKAAAALPAPPPTPMEDWWLVRNSRGQTGWIYARMIDITEPDALARYAEGQRIIGAYILAHAYDPESGILDNGQTVSSIPEYVTVLAPFKPGLPYDFDQVRVFIWNTKKHRYETGYREHDIVGYLPVTIATLKNPYGTAPIDQVPAPTFTYGVLPADSPIPVPDPVTGAIHPGRLIIKTIRLEGNIGRRVLPPNTTAPAQAHPTHDLPKGKAGKSKKHHAGQTG